MIAYLHYGKGNEPRLTVRVNHKTKPLYEHTHGLSHTASGYGKRIPTMHMVQVEGRWRRVYCCIHCNIGTLYIGNLVDGPIVHLKDE